MMKSRGRKEAASATPVAVYVVSAVLALAGLADATYLTVLHLTGQSALCSDAAACSQVLSSKYAAIGPVPVASIGAVVYFATFALATFAAFGRRTARRFLPVPILLMFAGTLWFLSVQAFILHSYCRYCLLSAAIVFILTGLVVAKPRPE